MHITRTRAHLSRTGMHGRTTKTTVLSRARGITNCASFRRWSTQLTIHREKYSLRILFVHYRSVDVLQLSFDHAVDASCHRLTTLANPEFSRGAWLFQLCSWKNNGRLNLLKSVQEQEALVWSFGQCTPE